MEKKPEIDKQYCDTLFLNRDMGGVEAIVDKDINEIYWFNKPEHKKEIKLILEMCHKCKDASCQTRDLIGQILQKYPE